MTKKYRLENLTPHGVDLKTENGDFVTIPTSGIEARVEVTNIEDGILELNAVTRIKTIHSEYGEIINLPKPTPGVLFIVSGYVATRAWELGRKDVVKPTEFIRENGVIVGAGALEFCDGTRLY